MLIAGAGMAGLVCAARARELGLRPRVVEKGTRAGGSMLLSSGVAWRHVEWDDFRAECPGGDEALQRLIWERLDEALAWLVSLGAEAVWDDTPNWRTTGKRFDPRELTRLLAHHVELETPLLDDAEGPVVVATGGWGKTLAEQQDLLLRANPWSDGGGIAYATAHGADISGGWSEFYGRVMPAPPARIREEDFVPLSQLYGAWARVYTEEGREITPSTVAWHESDLAQRIGPRAWFVLDDKGLAHAQERVDAARAAGATVIDPAELPFATPPGSRLAVHVAAAVTHTFGGVRVDTDARALDAEGVPIDGLYAAGVDVGGVATGGYASGLAQALVLGLVAAEGLAAG
jgi:fumarate reductase flavoprotein subunit